MKVNLHTNPDILIVGAGIIGLSLALELEARGAQVTVLERDTALSHASSAAAGMLAADDPHNPPELHALAQYSIARYDSFLARVASLSGIAVPYQTSITHQYAADGSSTILHEHSLDPRQLAVALLAAVRASSINLREHTPFSHPFAVSKTVYATGAWTHPSLPLAITPVKGQMLRVQLPANLPLREVHRSEHIYIVPRTQGPQAGTAIIGATLEDAGFDTTTHTSALNTLRAHAATLLPQLASPTAAPTIDSWAGLRPATPDHLPILGRIGSSNDSLATGHFRNGILLAPATASILADLLEDKTPPIDIAPFTPSRFV
jgi:glycine oxidase